jgi:uncharacterized protein YdiU (UPF0061 family)
MASKLGFEGDPGAALVDDLLAVMGSEGLDWTSTFRMLADDLRQADAQILQVSAGGAIHEWKAGWVEALKGQGRSLTDAADAMDSVNPVYIPRNHMVHDALEAAHDGDLGPFGELFERVTDPFSPVPGAERYALPAPDEFASVFRTFCGT